MSMFGLQKLCDAVDCCPKTLYPEALQVKAQESFNDDKNCRKTSKHKESWQMWEVGHSRDIFVSSPLLISVCVFFFKLNWPKLSHVVSAHEHIWTRFAPVNNCALSFFVAVSWKDMSEHSRSSLGTRFYGCLQAFEERLSSSRVSDAERRGSAYLEMQSVQELFWYQADGQFFVVLGADFVLWL